MPKDLISRLNWENIYPPFRDQIFELVARCRARGADYFATSGFRSPEEQLALYQKGRNAEGAVVDPGKVVTKVRFSLHCVGLAIDFTFDLDLTKPRLQPSWKASDYTILAEEAERLGLEPGLRWRSFPDAPHVQLPIGKKNITITTLRGLYGKAGLKAVHGLLDRNGPFFSP